MPAPVNTSPPVITGTATVGSTLAVSDGVWTGGVDSYAYAWLRSGTAIAGATASTYVVQRDDISATLVARVTATNADGSATANSLPTSAVPSTLIVETGAIVPGADSYITLAYAQEYHAKMGNSAWASIASDNLRESYIRRAMAYLTQMYLSSWKGFRVSATQSLDWPREFVQLPASVYGGYVANNIVPAEVKNACAELALKAVTETLNPDSTQSVKRKTVGPITIEFDQYSPRGKRYDSIQQMLMPYLAMSGISVELVK